MKKLILILLFSLPAFGQNLNLSLECKGMAYDQYNEDGFDDVISVEIKDGFFLTNKLEIDEHVIKYVLINDRYMESLNIDRVTGKIQVNNIFRNGEVYYRFDGLCNEANKKF